MPPSQLTALHHCTVTNYNPQEHLVPTEDVPMLRALTSIDHLAH